MKITFFFFNGATFMEIVVRILEGGVMMKMKLERRGKGRDGIDPNAIYIDYRYQSLQIYIY